MTDKHIEKKIAHLLSKTETASPDTGLCVSVLAQGGSDRIFYRVGVAGKTFVVMASRPLCYESRVYYHVDRFLSDLRIGVPEIFAFDEDSGLVLMEDLGDDSLLNLLRRSESRAEIERIYKKVIEALSEMQTVITPAMDRCEWLNAKEFGYEALRWETDYFIECFVKGYCRLKIEHEGKIEDEMDRLALILSTEPRYFMHRDFQSQNIYIKQGRVRIIDFQTAKKGLFYYDLASLLKDAYFRLLPEERHRLLDHYLEHFSPLQHRSFNKGDFLQIFHLAGLQRNMQALGAFAYLGTVKGKKQFLHHIPLTVSYLKEALQIIDHDLFPELARTVDRLATSPEFS